MIQQRPAFRSSWQAAFVSAPWVGITLVAVAFLISRVGIPLTDGDTAFYARIARNIIDSGDWQTLRFKDYPLIDKPPLTLWLIALSYYVFGVNEIAIRSWHTLMAVGTLLITYATARLFFAKRIASLGAWTLLSSVLFIYCSMVPQQDIPLTFFSAGAFYGFARFMRGDGWRYTHVFWISTALGVLARGMQAFVFPVAVAGLTLLLTIRKGAWRESLRPWTRAAGHLTLGIALFGLIALPWFLLEYQVHGELFFDTFFGAGNARFFQTATNRSGLAHFFAYIPLLLAAFLPWSGLIWHALRHAVRHALRSGDRLDPQKEARLGYDDSARLGIQLFTVWFAVAFALPFTIHWRVIRYLLPALPALAVLVAVYLDPLFDGDQRDTARVARGVRIAGLLGLLVVVPVLLLTAAIVLKALPPEQAAYAPVILPWLISLAGAMGFFAAAGWLKKPRLAVIGLTTGGIVSCAVLVAMFGGLVTFLNPWKEAADIVNATAAPGSTVIWADGGDNWFLDFYVERPVGRVSDLDFESLSHAPEGTWIIGTDTGVNRLLHERGLEFEQVWEKGDATVGRVKAQTARVTQ